jgi:drug/metabolite transporter (DMT)-like permease
MVIAGSRSAIAALSLLLIRRFTVAPARSAVKSNQSRKLLIAGALTYALTMMLFVTANKLTASANAILLQYSAPIWAALLGWALIGEKPRREQWAALAAVVLGLSLFFRDGLQSGALAGDIIAVLSGIAFGANSVFLRLQKEGNPIDSMTIAHIITALTGAVFAVMDPPALSPVNLAIISFMGIVQIGLASFLFAFGIKRVAALQAMLIAVLEPVCNPLWVLLATGEKPGPSALAGGAVILSAIFLSSFAGIRTGKMKSGA